MITGKKLKAGFPLSACDPFEMIDIDIEKIRMFPLRRGHPSGAYILPTISVLFLFSCFRRFSINGFGTLLPELPKKVQCGFSFIAMSCQTASNDNAGSPYPAPAMQVNNPSLIELYWLRLHF